MFFFDLDGTLVDSNGIWQEVDRTFLARRKLPYTRAYYEGVAHTILPVAAEFTKDYCQLTESCGDIIAEWMALAESAYAQSVPLKPGVRAYLEQCRAEGRRLAIITSSVPEHCRTVLAQHGLEPYFEQIFFAHDLGLEKREPAIFRHAATACGVAVEDCTVFDDSLAACRGARAAGMRVVGMYDPFFDSFQAELRSFCDVYLTSFEELLVSGRD